MTTTTTQRLTLEEYLNYVEMPSGSDLNNLIAIMLLFAFGQYVPPKLLRRGTEIVINS